MRRISYTNPTADASARRTPLPSHAPSDLHPFYFTALPVAVRTVFDASRTRTADPVSFPVRPLRAHAQAGVDAAPLHAPRRGVREERAGHRPPVVEDILRHLVAHPPAASPPPALPFRPSSPHDPPTGKAPPLPPRPRVTPALRSLVHLRPGTTPRELCSRSQAQSYTPQFRLFPARTRRRCRPDRRTSTRAPPSQGPA